MKYINLFKSSSTPLYAQLKDSIKQAIKSGQLKPNDKLPTEEEICAEFRISRPVVRQAYKELLDENYIVRFKSRGTFVKEVEIKSMFFSEFSDIEIDLENMGHNPKVLCISKQVISINDCNNLIKETLKSSDILKVKLLYLNDDLPLVFKEAYYPLDIIKGIQLIDFEVSPIYNTLETKFNLWLSHIKKVVDAQIIRDDLVDILKTEKGHAVHVVESLAYDDRDRVLEIAYSYYVGDRNEFDLMVYKQI
ncbi:MAG: GntR family transcriptional regulator [Erysipelotrichaceae bacterium]|jgi:GntR family transcriptional regulator